MRQHKKLEWEDTLKEKIEEMKEKLYSIESLKKGEVESHLNDLITESQKNKIQEIMELLSKG